MEGYSSNLRETEVGGGRWWLAPAGNNRGGEKSLDFGFILRVNRIA